jgi:hypothetical protein
LTRRFHHRRRTGEAPGRRWYAAASDQLSEIASGQINGFKWNDVKNHIHPAAWNFLHWLQRYAIAITAVPSHYYKCRANGSTSPGNYGYHLTLETYFVGNICRGMHVCNVQSVAQLSLIVLESLALLLSLPWWIFKSYVKINLAFSIVPQFFYASLKLFYSRLGETLLLASSTLSFHFILILKDGNLWKYF